MLVSCLLKPTLIQIFFIVKKCLRWVWKSKLSACIISQYLGGSCVTLPTVIALGLGSPSCVLLCLPSVLWLQACDVNLERLARSICAFLASVLGGYGFVASSGIEASVHFLVCLLSTWVVHILAWSLAAQVIRYAVFDVNRPSLCVEVWRSCLAASYLLSLFLLLVTLKMACYGAYPKLFLIVLWKV